MTNLVYCLDGTTNEYDSAYPTNVVMMHKSVADTDATGNPQHVYYDAGVGTKLGQNLLGMCFGYGLMKNVLQAYENVCTHYQTGDQIFILGFSRGAYTARSLAGLIGYVGILDTPSPKNIERAEFFYKQRLNKSKKHLDAFAKWRAKNCSQHCANQTDYDFRQTCPTVTNAVPDIVKIRYVGVWDTVKTIGLNERKYQWHDHDLSENVDYARHAIALDERRNKFKITEWTNIGILNNIARLEGREGEPYQQKYFPGNHGSIGGGGPIKGLSDEVFQWVREGAKEAGLSFQNSGDGELFHLTPNPLDWLDNTVGKPMGFFAKRMNKVANFGIGIFGFTDRPGPRLLENVSHTALVRYFAKSDILPERIDYRPGSLKQISPLLDRQGSPFTDTDYRSLTESVSNDGLASDEEKYVVVSGFRYRVHIVKKGESLSGIAKQYYGDAQRWPEIYSANKASIANPDRIYVSQRILVPIVQAELPAHGKKKGAA